MEPFHNCLANLTRAVERSGSHYFDRDTMRCFNTRTYDMYDTGDGAYLVVSDRDARGFGIGDERVRAYGGRRYYRFVFVTAEGEVQREECERLAPALTEESLINAWWTLDTARKYARQCAKERRARVTASS